MSASGPRAAVVFNRPVLPPDHPDAASESDVVGVAEAVARALEGNGFRPSLVAVGPPLSEAVVELSAAAPDLVFNLVEGFGGASAGATTFTAVFELLGVPYTGSPVEALAVCASKARTKALLRGVGLQTAPSVLAGPSGPVPRPDFEGPYLVKPDAEDASLGIGQESVIADPSGLPGLVESLRARYGGPVLVEAYLPGPEFNVGVVSLPDPRALPVAQVMFSPSPGRWPILTYAAKWAEGSVDDLASPVVCPAPIDRALADRLASLAVSAFRATGCRDYARVDFRCDARGEPVVLEVNPNPDIGPRAGLARAVRAGGGTYEAFLASVAREALGRQRRQ